MIASSFSRLLHATEPDERGEARCGRQDLVSVLMRFKRKYE